MHLFLRGSGRAAVFLAVLCGASAMASAQNVLFVGNSLTGTQTSATGEDLPMVLSRLAASRGKSPNLQKVINMGQTLQDTWNAGLAQPYLTGSTQWDLVVLQEFSTLPVTDPGAFDATVLSTYQPAVQRSLRPSAGRLVLFQNWALVDPAPYATRADDHAALDANYLSLSKQLSVPNLIEPIGDAFEKVFATRPLEYLIQPDGKHPDDAAIYLNACMFYALVFHESPVGLPALYLPAADAAFLQGIAAQLAEPGNPGGTADAGTAADAGVDAGTAPDAGTPDTGPPDAGTTPPPADAGSDPGVLPPGGTGTRAAARGGCSSGAPLGWIAALGAIAAGRRRRRRAAP